MLIGMQGECLSKVSRFEHRACEGAIHTLTRLEGKAVVAQLAVLFVAVRQPFHQAVSGVACMRAVNVRTHVRINVPV